MKPLLIIDFDSTFIKDETLDEIAKFLSSNDNSKILKEKIASITNQAMEGTLDFSTALKKRVTLLSIHQKQIQEIINILQKRISDSFLTFGELCYYSYKLISRFFPFATDGKTPFPHRIKTCVRF